MSRFSPTVQVHALDLGGALSAGADSYLQMKQFQHQRDEEAFQSGLGVKLPQPETTQNAPVSIMASAGAVPNTQTPQSAALPGVAGLPSPGRIQGMNVPGGAQPPSDLGPALQTGQQRAINGVAQPHDDLRDAISNVGKQVTADSQQPIMSLASQSYTPPPTQRGGGMSDPNAMATLPSGQQVSVGMLPMYQRQQAAQLEGLVKRADVQKSLSAAGESDALAGLHQKEGDPQFIQAKAQAEADGKFADELHLEVMKNNLSYESASKLAKLHGGLASQLLDQRLSGEAANQAANSSPYEFVTGTDPATGKPMIERGNKKTGTLEPTGIEGKLPAAAGGLTDRSRAQLATASGQAELADKGMTDYENKVLAGTISLNPIEMHLARSAIAGSTSAETALNTINPELASYVRFQKQIATAERMITPRGGSNATTQAEALLSGAGASGTPQQITNARQYRAALIHGLRSPGAAPAPAPATPPAQTPGQLWDAAVKLHGEAKVRQEYGARPTE